MNQLLTRGINTVKYSNIVFRNCKEMGNIIVLREDTTNTEVFSVFSDFKDLVLDLSRQVNTDYITDILILITPSGDNNVLEAVDNRLFLILESQASFSSNGSRFTPVSGDLIWSNDKIIIENNETNPAVLLIIDFKEFLI